MNSRDNGWRRGAALATVLTPLALAIHGYHPYAEDGGIYVAGVKRLLNPALYGANPVFVLAPMRTSLFAPVVAGLVRWTHVPLAWTLVVLYAGSVWLTLFAGWRLAMRFSSDEKARAGAAVLLACWLTLPVAGTSLYLADPYLTARSFSTPLVLLALGNALGGRRAVPGVLTALGLAALFHPLMAGYGAAAVVSLVAFRVRGRQRWFAVAAVCVGALGLGGIVQAGASPETPEYLQAALTRYYWFPLQWHWYEQLGAVAPIVLLPLLARGGSGPARALAGCGVLLGCISLVVAISFCRAGLPVHLVARMQPLRALQLVYVILIVLGGALLGEHGLRRRAARWAGLIVLAGAPMMLAGRQTYANSDHFEWPGLSPRNPWQQAFLYARDHTSAQAVFALDAHYITQGPHEDAQCFRAMAEREVLPDYSKDGGEAAIAPDLTAAWRAGVDAQTGLDQESDEERGARLRPLGAGWVILQEPSPTRWTCLYRNGTVKVCRVQ